MKQKYTLSVADTEIHILTDEPKESVETIVGVLDRRLREIHLKSRGCSRIEAAILCALDYCAEKFKLQKKIKLSDAEISRLSALNDTLTKENAALSRELDALRHGNGEAAPVRPAPRRASMQLSFTEDVEAAENGAIEADVPVAETAEPAPETVSEPVAKPADEPAPEETAPEGKKPSRVRSMFDLISFDDV